MADLDVRESTLAPRLKCATTNWQPGQNLALAEEAENIEARRLASEAFSWLTKRYSREKALEWCTNIYLRGIVRRLCATN